MSEKKLSKQRRWQIKQKKLGNCVNCGKKRKKNAQYCDKCKIKNKKYAKKADAKRYKKVKNALNFQKRYKGIKIFRVDCVFEKYSYEAKMDIARFSNLWLLAKDKREAKSSARKILKDYQPTAKIEKLEAKRCTSIKNKEPIVRIDGVGSEWSFTDYL